MLSSIQYNWSSRNSIWGSQIWCNHYMRRLAALTSFLIWWCWLFASISGLTCVTDVTVTRLRAGQSGVWIAVGEINCSLLQNLQTDSGAHRAFYSMGTGVISLEVKNECNYSYYPHSVTPWLGQVQLYLFDICSALWFLQNLIWSFPCATVMSVRRLVSHLPGCHCSLKKCYRPHVSRYHPLP